MATYWAGLGCLCQLDAPPSFPLPVFDTPFPLPPCPYFSPACSDILGANKQVITVALPQLRSSDLGKQFNAS